MLIGFCMTAWNVVRSQQEPQSYLVHLGGNSIGISALSATHEGGALMCALDTNGLIIFRTDPSGAVLWSGIIPYISGDTILHVNKCGEFEDGHYFIAGEIFPNAGNEFFVASIGINGSLLWLKRYILPLLDDDFLTGITGYCDSDELQLTMGGYNAIRLCRLDVDGNIIRTGKFIPPGDIGNTSSMLSVSDNGGGQFICNILRQTFGAIRIPCITHLDSTGAVLWAKSYTLGSYADIVSMTGTMDGGIVLTGWMTDAIGAPSYPFILKISPTGDVQWRRTHTTQLSSINQAFETDVNQLVCVTYPDPQGIVFMHLGADGSAISAVRRSLLPSSFMFPRIVWANSEGFRLAGHYQYNVQNWLAIYGLFQMEVTWSDPITCGFEEYAFTNVPLSLPTVINSNIGSTPEFIVQSDVDADWLEFNVTSMDYCSTVTGINERMPVEQASQHRTQLVMQGDPVYVHNLPNNSMLQVVDVLGHIQFKIQVVGQNGVSLNTQSLAPGTYFVVISGPDHELRKERFVVE